MILIETTSDFNSAMYGTAGAVVAGYILQYANKILNRKKENLEEHLVLRKELREELDAVKEEIFILQKSLDEWKEKYYHQVELTHALKAEVMRLTDELTEHKIITGNYPTSDFKKI
jgi:hypothetical protein